MIKKYKYSIILSKLISKIAFYILYIIISSRTKKHSDLSYKAFTLLKRLKKDFNRDLIVMKKKNEKGHSGILFIDLCLIKIHYLYI